MTGKIRGDCVQKGMLYLAEKTAGIATHSAISRAEKEGEETTYVSSFMGVEAWRKNEALDSFDVLKKGNLVTVEGYFKPEEWTDAESGAKRSRIVMVATKFYLAPEKEEEKHPKRHKENLPVKQLSPATIRTASGYRSPLQRKGFKRVGKKKAAGIKNKKRSCGCLEESRACSLSRRTAGVFPLFLPAWSVTGK